MVVSSGQLQQPSSHPQAREALGVGWVDVVAIGIVSVAVARAGFVARTKPLMILP
jgi:hypothetical protein